jgi:DNA-binding NarL/FixJ family response regulator
MVRVLICDDVAELRALLRLALTDCDGVDVIAEAANGAEAVELVGIDAPDVVLLDLTMPVMSGLEALPRLRELAPDTKVVIYSGFVTDAVKAQAMSLGASRCLSKAEGVREVCAAVRDLVDA